MGRFRKSPNIRLPTSQLLAFSHVFYLKFSCHYSSQWWTVTWKCKPNNFSPPTVIYGLSILPQHRRLNSSPHDNYDINTLNTTCVFYSLKQWIHNDRLCCDKMLLCFPSGFTAESSLLLQRVINSYGSAGTRGQCSEYQSKR